MNGHTPPHVTPIILLLGQNAEIHFNERVNKISLGGNASSTTYIGSLYKKIYIYISSDWYNQIPNYSLMILTHFLFDFKTSRVWTYENDTNTHLSTFKAFDIKIKKCIKFIN